MVLGLLATCLVWGEMYAAMNRVWFKNLLTLESSLAPLGSHFDWGFLYYSHSRLWPKLPSYLLTDFRGTSVLQWPTDSTYDLPVASQSLQFLLFSDPTFHSFLAVTFVKTMSDWSKSLKCVLTIAEVDPSLTESIEQVAVVVIFSCELSEMSPHV